MAIDSNAFLAFVFSWDTLNFTNNDFALVLVEPEISSIGGPSGQFWAVFSKLGFSEQGSF